MVFVVQRSHTCKLFWQSLLEPFWTAEREYPILEILVYWVRNENDTVHSVSKTYVETELLTYSTTAFSSPCIFASSDIRGSWLTGHQTMEGD